LYSLKTFSEGPISTCILLKTIFVLVFFENFPRRTYFYLYSFENYLCACVLWTHSQKDLFLLVFFWKLYLCLHSLNTFTEGPISACILLKNIFVLVLFW